ncbi:MAG: helix-turn-helix transcriptional regulator [Bacteriovorax sp.]|nr:helix-turn-helix transcriptional regulator [Bacteriovorax sp.]
MNSEFNKQIKNVLKLQGITQEEFAQQMKVSVPTIKRWLKGEGVLFTDLIRMLDCLGLRLSEVAMMFEGALANKFTYTLKQEQLFVSIEGLLAFFDQLLKGRSPSQIARTYSLTEKSVVFYLSHLDKSGLIEWLPKNKARVLVTGEPSWIKGGPLSQKFRRQIIDGHIANYVDDRDHLKIGIYSLSKESQLKVNSMLIEVTEKVRGLEVRDSQSKDTKKITTLILGHGHNEIPILTNISNK